jgi:hypothetical protein
LDVLANGHGTLSISESLNLIAALVILTHLSATVKIFVLDVFAKKGFTQAESVRREHSIHTGSFVAPIRVPFRLNLYGSQQMVFPMGFHCVAPSCIPCQFGSTAEIGFCLRCCTRGEGEGEGGGGSLIYPWVSKERVQVAIFLQGGDLVGVLQQLGYQFLLQVF